MEEKPLNDVGSVSILKEEKIFKSVGLVINSYGVIAFGRFMLNLNFYRGKTLKKNVSFSSILMEEKPVKSRLCLNSCGGKAFEKCRFVLNSYGRNIFGEIKM